VLGRFSCSRFSSCIQLDAYPESLSGWAAHLSGVRSSRRRRYSASSISPRA
jgi:hypothetical protein